jgi:DNA-binding winged helix-turn-helix (wHTH) protein
MVEPDNETYCFDGWRLDALKRVLRDEHDLDAGLTSKSIELLLMLVKNAGSVVTKDQILAAVWPETVVSENVVSVNIAALRKALGERGGDRRYIITIPGSGYRFVASVQQVAASSQGLSESNGRTYGVVAADDEERLASGHLRYLIVAAVLYAGLYAVEVVSEVAYRFDSYGKGAVRGALLLFSWILVTSGGGIAIDSRLTRRDHAGGLLAAVSVFGVGAVSAFGIGCVFLPSLPVTQAVFQTYTAQGAYLKDIMYNLPLGLLFVVVPFHFVIVMEHELRQGKEENCLLLLTGSERGVWPEGAFYLRPWLLSLLLLLMAAYSLMARAHLFDNLLPSPYMNLFAVLTTVRSLVLFALGTLSIAWYYGQIQGLKARCLRSGRLRELKSVK